MWQTTKSYRTGLVIRIGLSRVSRKLIRIHMKNEEKKSTFFGVFHLNTKAVLSLWMAHCSTNTASMQFTNAKLTMSHVCARKQATYHHFHWSIGNCWKLCIHWKCLRNQCIMIWDVGLRDVGQTQRRLKIERIKAKLVFQSTGNPLPYMPCKWCGKKR